MWLADGAKLFFAIPQAQWATIETQLWATGGFLHYIYLGRQRSLQVMKK